MANNALIAEIKESVFTIKRINLSDTKNFFRFLGKNYR